ncbi:MAG: DUF3786 domain-containing protein [Deltaproteobacteria bacterium]
MATVLEILRATPRTNCGGCGYPACMAFAAACATGAAHPSQCPYIRAEGLDTLCAGDGHEAAEAGATIAETALLKDLREKIRHVDLAARAGQIGAETVDEGGETALTLPYLGRSIKISAGAMEDPQGGEPDPRDQILLYNYIFFGGKGGLSGEWVGLESFPNSISKVVTLRKYTEDKLASAFTGKVTALEEAARRLGGRPARDCHADLCMVIPVLPMVPIQILFWDADEEDGFPARAKVLFDARALTFLDIESLIFAAERMAETIIGLP